MGGMPPARTEPAEGHSSPMLTLKTYAHAMREEEVDLSFAEFEIDGGSKRLYPAPGSEPDTPNEDAPGLSDRGRSTLMEHETGFGPATLTLAT